MQKISALTNTDAVEESLENLYRKDDGSAIKTISVWGARLFSQQMVMVAKKKGTWKACVTVLQILNMSCQVDAQ